MEKLGGREFDAENAIRRQPNMAKGLQMCTEKLLPVFSSGLNWEQKGG